MVKSKFLRSGSNPLWVAAFCFKNLKKAQLLDTDIPSSVDQILQDEMDAVSYRVLGYLLLGVVRIYSEKVDYVLHHCNEMIKIHSLKISREDIARVETLRMSVTIPDRFELDAFELDVLEDADRYHIAPPEEITLKDKEVVFITEGLELFSHEKFEDFDISENTFSFDHHKEENIRLSQLLMDVEFFQQNNTIDLSESRDILVDEERIGLDLTPLSKCPGDLGSIRLSQLLMDVEVFQQNNTIDLSEIRDIPVDEERIGLDLTPQSKCQGDLGSICPSQLLMDVEVFQRNNKIDLSESRDIPGDEERIGLDLTPQSKCQGDLGSICPSQLLMDVEVFQQNNTIDLSESRDIPVDKERIGLDLTPQSKCQGDDDSAERPKRGATTSESILINTPAVRESPYFSRKRKVVIDAMIVLPNELLKKSLRDARDLISNRRKSHRTLRSVQRESLISSLPNRFYEPLLPCSSELQFVETSGKLLESQTACSPEEITAPASPPHYPGSLEIEGTPRTFDVSESQASTLPKHIASPPTPPCPQRIEVQNLDSPESIEIEQLLETNEVLTLLDEEINSSGTENSELLAGWSNRTRKVASYLNKSFLHPRAQREENVVNFSQVLGSGARKESARLFYEVLVLKTTDYVDVEQNEAYGDIAISKLTKLDQKFLI